MLVRFCATFSLKEIFQTLVTDFLDAKSAMADMFLHTSMCGVVAIVIATLVQVSAHSLSSCEF